MTCAQISPAGFNQSHLQFLKPLGPWDANSRSHLCGRLVSAERVSGLGGGRERHPRVSWRREPHTEDFCPGLCVKAGTMWNQSADRKGRLRYVPVWTKQPALKLSLPRRQCNFFSGRALIAWPAGRAGSFVHQPAKGGGGVSAMPGRRLQFLVLICSTRATLAPSHWGELNFQLNIPRRVCISLTLILPWHPKDFSSLVRTAKTSLSQQANTWHYKFLQISRSCAGGGVTKTVLSWEKPISLCRALPNLVSRQLWKPPGKAS